jgi:hypothetical protein
MWPVEEKHKHHQHSHRGREGGGQTSGVGPPAATLSTEGDEVKAAVITSTSCFGMAVSQASNSAAPIRWASHPARPQEATPPDAHALLVCCSSRALSPLPRASSKSTTWRGCIRRGRHLQPQPCAQPRSPPPRRARVLGRLLGRGGGGRAPPVDASPRVGSAGAQSRGDVWAAVAFAAAALGLAGRKSSVAVQEQQ